MRRLTLKQLQARHPDEPAWLLEEFLRFKQATQGMNEAQRAEWIREHQAHLLSLLDAPETVRLPRIEGGDYCAHASKD